MASHMTSSLGKRVSWTLMNNGLSLLYVAGRVLAESEWNGMGWDGMDGVHILYIMGGGFHAWDLSNFFFTSFPCA